MLYISEEFKHYKEKSQKLLKYIFPKLNLSSRHDLYGRGSRFTFPVNSTESVVFVTDDKYRITNIKYTGDSVKTQRRVNVAVEMLRKKRRLLTHFKD